MARLLKPVLMWAILLSSITILAACGPIGMRTRQMPVSDDEAAAALEVGRTYIGTPYKLGGQTRDGIDCSGLVVEAYKAVIPGVRFLLPLGQTGTDASASDLYWYNLLPTPLSRLKPGDLLFMSDGSAPVTHVQMLISLQDTKVTFLNASSRLGLVVIDTWDITSPEWKAQFIGSGRLNAIL